MKIKNVSWSILLNVIGVCLYAIGINCFAAPNKIAPGGASGIAVLINYITGWSIGAFVFFFNIPLALWIFCKKTFPLPFIGKTMATTALLAVITDFVVIRFPLYYGDPLLAAVFGGVLMGAGLAFVHLGKSNTGGISLLGLILKQNRASMPVGEVIAILNILVVLASGVVYKNIESLLVALLTVYISGIVMDRLLNKASAKNLMIIISEYTDKIRQVFLEAHKGITILNGEGGYSSTTQEVILCAVTKNDCNSLERQVKEIDTEALIIVTNASRIEGKGFGHLV